MGAELALLDLASKSHFGRCLPRTNSALNSLSIANKLQQSTLNSTHRLGIGTLFSAAGEYA
jgi:hypothetical protein